MGTIVKCKQCGSELEKTSDCPIYCPKCDDQICPECFNILDGEYHEYCGYNCSHCGWTHCYKCE